MASPLNSTAAASLGLLCARVPMGVYFALAGLHKITGGIGKFVDGTIGLATKVMPEQLGRAFLTALPFAELLVGISLVFGLLGRLGGLVGSLLLISFLIAATGVAPGSSGGPFHPNLVFLGVALLVLFAGPGKISLDNVIFKPKPPTETTSP
ncbi:MAG TPA: DoxX family protein [Tepidisphaeraceae bacterium]|jgi:uncharacterized membrane protein YphA (DoxX/SURF4 family)